MGEGLPARRGQGVRGVRCCRSRRVRPRSTGGVRQLGRLLLQPAVAQPPDGRADARGDRRRHRRGVLRRPPGRPAPRPPSRRREPIGERAARRVDGLGHVDGLVPVAGAGGRHGAPGGGRTPRSRCAHRRRTRRAGTGHGGRPRGGLDPVLRGVPRRVARPRCRTSRVRGDRTARGRRQGDGRARQRRVGGLVVRPVGPRPDGARLRRAHSCVRGRRRRCPRTDRCHVARRQGVPRRVGVRAGRQRSPWSQRVGRPLTLVDDAVRRWRSAWSTACAGRTTTSHRTSPGPAPSPNASASPPRSGKRWPPTPRRPARSPPA